MDYAFTQFQMKPQLAVVYLAGGVGVNLVATVRLASMMAEKEETIRALLYLFFQLISPLQN